MYKKQHSFKVIAASLEAEPKDILSMRDLIKANQVARKVTENDFSEFVDQSGVRYLPYAQAILYNYFSTLTMYPVYLHEQNTDDFVAFMRLSLEMGGFPLCDVIYEDGHSSVEV